MIRSAVGRVMWVGRTASMVFGLALVLALVLGVATVALAAVPGDPFRLGQLNSINAITQLVGSRDGAMLRVDNNSTGANAHGLNLEVNANKPPLRVNPAAGTATNLSADELDGKDSDELVRSGLGSNRNLFSAVSFTGTTSATVNAPADGFVIVNGTVINYIWGSSASICNPCHAHAHIFNTTTNQGSPDQTVSLGNGTSTTHQDVLPMSWVFPVDAGDNTFELRTGTYPSSAPVAFYNPTLTALYVPYGANGTSALASASKLASPTGEQWEESPGGTMIKK